MKYRGWETVSKPIWDMTPEERREYEKKRKKFDPKTLFEETGEAKEKPLDPTTKGYEGTIKGYFRNLKPKTKDLWADDEDASK